MEMAVPVVDTTPAEVIPYLLPIEKHVISVRKHPAVLTLPACLPVADVTAFALCAAGVIPGGTAALAVLGTLFAPFCYFLYRSVLAWWHAFFVVTNSRLILINWQRKRRMAFIPIEDAREMTYIRTLPSRIIGYGSFMLKMSGPHAAASKISYLPYPEQLYLEVTALVLRTLPVRIPGAAVVSRSALTEVGIAAGP
jgi:hypothetical protein